jgi:hypothetical protein
MSLQALAVGGHVSLIGASLTPSGLDPLIADRPRETGANNPARPTARFEPPAPTPLVGSLANAVAYPRAGHARCE